MKQYTFGIAGTGHLGGIVARAWKDGFLPDYTLVGVAGKNREKTQALAEETGVPGFSAVRELMNKKPDILVEAASVEAVREIALPALKLGVSLVVLSVGAFADSEFYARVREAAEDSGAKVYIASGAVGGFDVLRTMALMGEAKLRFQARKNPASLQNTPLFTENLMTDREPSRVFSGTAGEAITLLPTKVNVAVASALASVGPDRAEMTIDSVPGMTGDEHIITGETQGVKAVIDIACASSDVAGWSAVAVLQNIASPIVF